MAFGPLPQLIRAGPALLCFPKRLCGPLLCRARLVHVAYPPRAPPPAHGRGLQLSACPGPRSDLTFPRTEPTGQSCRDQFSPEVWACSLELQPRPPGSQILPSPECTTISAQRCSQEGGCPPGGQGNTYGTLCGGKVSVSPQPTSYPTHTSNPPPFNHPPTSIYPPGPQPSPPLPHTPACRGCPWFWGSPGWPRGALLQGLWPEA